jgi:hypothetical protein
MAGQSRLISSGRTRSGLDNGARVYLVNIQSCSLAR